MYLKPISRKPAVAQDASIGQILSVIASILGVIGSALLAKDNAGGTSA